MMAIFTLSIEYRVNLSTDDTKSVSMQSESNDNDSKEQIILIIQSTIASIGIFANLSVIVVFLNHRKLRRKIPNIFIINQVIFVLKWITVPAFNGLYIYTNQ